MANHDQARLRHTRGLASFTALVALLVGHGGYVDREVTGGALTLTLIGFAVLTLGGGLGGTVVCSRHARRQRH